jgi:hypothetical protein
MEIEITPEPGPSEREALADALARVLVTRPDPRSGWWREGVSENVADGSAEAPGEAG